MSTASKELKAEKAELLKILPQFDLFNQSLNGPLKEGVVILPKGSKKNKQVIKTVKPTKN